MRSLAFSSFRTLALLVLKLRKNRHCRQCHACAQHTEQEAEKWARRPCYHLRVTSAKKLSTSPHWRPVNKAPYSDAANCAAPTPKRSGPNLGGFAPRAGQSRRPCGSRPEHMPAALLNRCRQERPRSSIQKTEDDAVKHLQRDALQIARGHDGPPQDSKTKNTKRKPHRQRPQVLVLLPSIARCMEQTIVDVLQQEIDSNTNKDGPIHGKERPSSLRCIPQQM